MVSAWVEKLGKYKTTYIKSEELVKFMRVSWIYIQLHVT